MIDSIWHYIEHHKLEITAVILSIAGVWLTAKEKISNWPIGIVACAIYTYIFYKDYLYGDASLQIFYIVIGFYGWYEWQYGGKENDKLLISKSTIKTLLVLLIITLPTSLVLGMLLSHTKSNVPYWDGFTTALSLAGTWMMAKKLIENWLVWIFTDLLYVVLYCIKGLYLTAILYFIFTALAIYGYYVWKKQLTQATFCA